MPGEGERTRDIRWSSKHSLSGKRGQCGGHMGIVRGSKREKEEGGTQ